MNKLVTVSFSENITENFKSVSVPFFKICDLVKSKFNYSAGSFDKNYRNKSNYKNYSDVLILDIDDGISTSEAKRIFEPFSYIIATTKSHQKDKNGKVCDRFRVIIPTDTPIRLNQDEYSQMMEEIYKDYPFVDKVCKDASRFYYPAKDSIIYTHEGFCYFYWEDYHKKAELKNKEIIENKRRIENLNKSFGEKLEYGNGEKIDYIRKIAKTEKLLELLKYNEKFVSGQRNKTLFSYGKYLQDLGMNEDEVRDYLLWINNQGDSIPENELIKTVFKSLKIN